MFGVVPTSRRLKLQLGGPSSMQIHPSSFLLKSFHHRLTTPLHFSLYHISALLHPWMPCCTSLAYVPCTELQGHKIALGRHVYKHPRCNIDLSCSVGQQVADMQKCRSSLRRSSRWYRDPSPATAASTLFLTSSSPSPSSSPPSLTHISTTGCSVPAG